MKVYLILGLLVAAACAEKKINLDDIERDNLRAESKSKTESIRTDESKYAQYPNINQQQYQLPSQYNTLGGHSEPYIPPQQFEDIKYNQLPPEAYIQPSQYAVHEAQYKQPSQILLQQNVLPVQHYSAYQQQAEIPAKNAASFASFESQKLSYQPEIVVGNQIQSIQQKAVTEKYTKTLNKEPVYLDVPATQLLSYYPHLNVNSLVNLKGARLTQPHQLASSTAQQISIPVYTPVYNQKQLVSSVKIPYSTILPATFTTKTTKGLAQPAPSKKYNSPSAALLTTPVYVQPQQSFTQGKTLLHTQAYIHPQPSQQQYVQQLVYAQPGVIYSDPTAAYSDFYARVPVQYIQDNSLRGQLNQQYQTQQQLYVPQQIAEAPKEILQEQIGQDLPQTYVKVVPDEPKTHFVPPQLPPQDFKSSITQLQPVPYEDEQALPQDHSLPSPPRSLLDSYIPSNVIAAQDAARYRERPIKLEGGFLPSKANFALKKRKSE